MAYHIDLETLSLEECAARLKVRYLVPSRQSILENLDAHIATIKSKGISNTAQLLIALKNKTKLEESAKLWSIDEPFLTLINREIKNWQKN